MVGTLELDGDNAIKTIAKKKLQNMALAIGTERIQQEIAIIFHHNRSSPLYILISQQQESIT